MGSHTGFRLLLSQKGPDTPDELVARFSHSHGGNDALAALLQIPLRSTEVQGETTVKKKRRQLLSCHSHGVHYAASNTGCDTVISVASNATFSAFVSGNLEHCHAPSTRTVPRSRTQHAPADCAT